jgi:hypothetical protein
MEIFSDFSVQIWFADAIYELKDYFRQLTSTQWGIICAASVVFGFLCLRGFTIRD